MKKLYRLHRYLSLFVAPSMIFFAVSGAWQAFRYQQNKKDGSYVAPEVLTKLSEVHMAERLSGTAGLVFRSTEVVLAAAFVATALVGIAMAFKAAGSHRPVWLALVAGALLPALIALAARAH
jgi:hypothetical protein